MIVLSTKCPDCGAPVTVTRELPDDEAIVTPTPCTGCGRRWAAAILQWRVPSGEITMTARLMPKPRRLSESKQGRSLLIRG